MQTESQEMVAVRQQIFHLLHQQIEALDSPLGLTDAGLTECYERQARVQELRERLQNLAELDWEESSLSNTPPAMPSGAPQLVSPSANSAANI